MCAPLRKCKISSEKRRESGLLLGLGEVDGAAEAVDFVHDDFERVACTNSRGEFPFFPKLAKGTKPKVSDSVSSMKRPVERTSATMASKRKCTVVDFAKLLGKGVNCIHALALVR